MKSPRNASTCDVMIVRAASRRRIIIQPRELQCEGVGFLDASQNLKLALGARIATSRTHDTPTTTHAYGSSAPRTAICTAIARISLHTSSTRRSTGRRMRGWQHAYAVPAARVYVAVLVALEAVALEAVALEARCAMNESVCFWWWGGLGGGGRERKSVVRLFLCMHARRFHGYGPIGRPQQQQQDARMETSAR